jgi:LCP family protein required for cell wall assembly
VLTGVTVLVASGCFSVAAYLRLDGNINRVDVTAALGARPSKKTPSGPREPMNILVMGSDTRKGIGTTRFGTDTVEGGAHSDTNLLVHLSADRTWATVASIPRDSMTRAPADCSDPDSTVDDGVVRQWNYNYNLGGPGCTIKTLEGLTDIYVDHFVVVDFRGFKDMVDALGGVEVCSDVPINDQDSGLALPAGRSHIDGTQALGYVRVRKTLNDGSDLHRIKRQQAFLSSIAQQATASSLLLRPDRLFGFLDAVTKSITTDTKMSVGTMKDIADSIKHLGIKNIDFVTVPTETYAPDPNRVEWTPAADGLWASIRNDEPLPGSNRAKELTSSGGATHTTAPLTASPDEIKVAVVNDAGTTGLAAQSAAALEAQGFIVTGARDGNYGSIDGVVVAYPPGKGAAAKTVAAAYPKSTLKPDATLSGTIEVHLGLGARHVVKVPNRIGNGPLPAQTITAPPAPTSSSETLQARPADQSICQTD